MSPEPQRRYPQWAERERQGDMRWIAENVHILWPAAQSAYGTLGRGAITVDATSQPIAGFGNPFAYLTQAELEPLRDEDMQRILRGYDPSKELVVVLFKTHQRTSTYRIQPQARP